LTVVVLRAFVLLLLLGTLTTRRLHATQTRLGLLLSWSTCASPCLRWEKTAAAAISEGYLYLCGYAPAVVWMDAYPNRCLRLPSGLIIVAPKRQMNVKSNHHPSLRGYMNTLLRLGSFLAIWKNIFQAVSQKRTILTFRLYWRPGPPPSLHRLRSSTAQRRQRGATCDAWLPTTTFKSFKSWWRCWRWP